MDGDQNNHRVDMPPGDAVDAPEKKITLFAFRIAILEKLASSLGVMGFVWATVVLLGGFAGSLRRTDFWLITATLLVESGRIFCLSSELDWQNLALAIPISLKHDSSAGTQTGDGKNNSPPAYPQTAASKKKSRPTSKRRWESQEVLMIDFPFAEWLFSAKNVSRLLYVLQLVSAIACIVFSGIGIKRHRTMSFDRDDMKNMKLALAIFYSLALSEAGLFLLETIYWQWKVNRGLFVDVIKQPFVYVINKAFGNDDKTPASVKRFYDWNPKVKWSIFVEVNDVFFDSDTHTLPWLKRFYYDAYSKCIHGSIFDGLKMDLVSYAEENLVSDSSEEQLLGVRILQGMAMNLLFTDDTIRKIETTSKTVERLIDMLSWTNKSEVELREMAAEVVEKLAKKNQNSLRVAACPESLESVSCLLDRKSRPDVYFDKLNIQGLKILKRLTRDQENCGKIGKTRELLSKIIRFTSGAKELLQENVAEKVLLSLEEITGHAKRLVQWRNPDPVKVKSFLEKIEGFQSDPNKKKLQRMHAAMIEQVDLSLAEFLQQAPDLVVALTEINTSAGAARLLLQQLRMIKKVKLALKVIKNLASTTGTIGSTLRRQLSEAVFTIVNIREILQCGQKYPNLQEIGIEILTSLAMEGIGRKRIGQTGGVIPVLAGIFFKDTNTNESIKAGDALSNLALNNEPNCKKILKVEGVVEKLVDHLDNQEQEQEHQLLDYQQEQEQQRRRRRQQLMLRSGWLLRDLYAHCGACRDSHKKAIIEKLPQVLKKIMNNAKYEQLEQLEMLIGLASQILDLASLEEMTVGLQDAKVEKIQLAETLVEVLKSRSGHSMEVPRMRRFVITLAMSMMKKETNCVSVFAGCGMKEGLNYVLDTTSSLECFSPLSGDKGLTTQYKTMEKLVNAALEILNNGGTSG